MELQEPCCCSDLRDAIVNFDPRVTYLHYANYSLTHSLHTIAIGIVSFPIISTTAFLMLMGYSQIDVVFAYHSLDCLQI